MAGALIDSVDAMALSDEEGVVEYLLNNGVCAEVGANFKKNLVTGEAFLALTEEDLKELVAPIGVRTKIRELLKKLKVSLLVVGLVELHNYGIWCSTHACYCKGVDRGGYSPPKFNLAMKK